ncbi:MAG: hypothetical protein J6T53_04520, partial [Bacteroidales bacterium]|nr:hypothetical protein [Bacteroidales bacterium]
REIGIIVIGTTISILLTIGSSQMLEKRQRAKDRNLTIMMVLSNIENNARQFESMAQSMAQLDTIGTWLLAQPTARLEIVPDKDIKILINLVTSLNLISHDETAEKIFSDNIDTWKNMESFMFINNVGRTFSTINQMEDYWKDWVLEMNHSVDEVINNPNDYEGKNIAIKCLNSEKVRNNISRIHLFRGWLSYVADLIRVNNRFNMACVGISEEEVLAFSDEYEKVEFNETTPANMISYVPAHLNPDSLITFKSLDDYLDSIAGK